MKRVQEMFRGIRQLAEGDFEATQGAAERWEDSKAIREKAKEALRILDGDGAGDNDGHILDLGQKSLADCFQVIRDLASEDGGSKEMAMACRNIIGATRRLEELLEPGLAMGVVSGMDPASAVVDPLVRADSEAFTRQTVASQPGAPSEQTDTGAEVETSNLPEAVSGGDTETKIQRLEHELLELKSQHQEHPRIAAVLHSLGHVYLEGGQLQQAKKYLEESLRMQQSLIGDSNDARVADTLHSLGVVGQQAGDLKGANEHFEKSLQMKRSLFGDSDSRIALTLHSLGELCQQRGNLKRGMQYLQESLNMQRSLHGDRDHPQIAATLQKMGDITAQSGDLKQAKQYLQESLQMQTSLRGDREHPDVAVSLHTLGDITARIGHVKEGMQFLQESLQMQRSLHGDRDHPGIATTLHKLGDVAIQARDLKQGTQYLHESLRMQRSLYGDSDHPGIATNLHKLGDVAAQSGDINQGMEYLQESLRMQRSLHGENDHPGIAATLHRLGDLTAQCGEIKRGMQLLLQSLQMQRSLHGQRDHPAIAAALQKLGDLAAQSGDLRQGIECLQQALRMQRALHGSREHPAIATTLQKLGEMATQAGDFRQGIECLQESLQMQQSLHGNRDHPGIATTLHKLGDLSAQSGEVDQAMQYLQQSLRMQRSLHGDREHLGIAITLHKMGDVAILVPDLPAGIQFFEESLRMQRSLHGDRPHAGIATTLRKLGDVTSQNGDHAEGMSYLQESLQVCRDLHVDKDHANIADALHSLGVVSQRAGDTQQAVNFLQQALQMKQSLFDSQHPSLKQTSELIERFHETEQIVQNFKKIRDAAVYEDPVTAALTSEEDVEAMFKDASRIREMAADIRSKLHRGTPGANDSEDFETQDLGQDSVFQLFEKIVAEAKQMSQLDTADPKVHATWARASAHIIWASERVEEILGPKVRIKDHLRKIRDSAFELTFQTPDQNVEDYDTQSFVWEEVGLIRQEAKEILKIQYSPVPAHLDVQNLPEVINISVMQDAKDAKDGKDAKDAVDAVIKEIVRISDTMRYVAGAPIKNKTNYLCERDCRAIISETWNMEDLLVTFVWSGFCGKVSELDWTIKRFREIRELALECESKIEANGFEDSDPRQSDLVKPTISQIQKLALDVLHHYDYGEQVAERTRPQSDRVLEIFGDILDVAAEVVLAEEKTSRSHFFSACREVLHSTHRMDQLLMREPEPSTRSSEEVQVPEPEPEEGSIQFSSFDPQAASAAEFVPEAQPSYAGPSWSYFIKVGITDSHTITAEYVLAKPDDCVAKYLPWTPDGNIYYHLWIQRTICLHHVTGTCVKKEHCKWLHPNYNRILEALMDLPDVLPAQDRGGKDRRHDRYGGK